MTTINRRHLRSKLGSRTVRRNGTKIKKNPKPRPATLVAAMVREELAKREAK